MQACYHEYIVQLYIQWNCIIHSGIAKYISKNSVTDVILAIQQKGLVDGTLNILIRLLEFLWNHYLGPLNLFYLLDHTTQNL